MALLHFAVMDCLPVPMLHLMVGSVRAMPLLPSSVLPVPLQGLEESRQIKGREEEKERERICLAASSPMGKDLNQFYLPQTQYLSFRVTLSFSLDPQTWNQVGSGWIIHSDSWLTIHSHWDCRPDPPPVHVHTLSML